MRAVLLAIALLGCNKRINPEWCAQPGNEDPACDHTVDGRTATCAKDDDCDGDLVCDTSITDGACVACTATNAGACSPPICAGNKCVACVDNSDCSSQVCLPSGECANQANVLYARPNGSGTACTMAMKCTGNVALQQISPTRNIIMLDPGMYNATGGVVLDRDVQIIGRGAIVDANGNGPVVRVTNSANVLLAYMRLTGAPMMAGVRCETGSLALHAMRIGLNGIGIVSSCALTVERSEIRGNPAGAIDVMGGTIEIRNNFIVDNGHDLQMRAPNIDIAAGVTGTFSFNTVAYNNSHPSVLPGLRCPAGVTGQGNIVTDNHRAGTFNINPQVLGGCDLGTSYTLPGAGGNDLAWVNVPTDFHLTAASTPVLDVAGVDCIGRVDFDGEPRSMGAACDLGADELRPQ